MGFQRARMYSHTVLAAVLVITLMMQGTSASASATVRTSMVSTIWTEPASGYGFILEAINHARTSVELSMYELSDTAIELALIDRAQSGVSVKVILNADYEGKSENEAAFDALRAGSVHVVWAPDNQIFHAKYMVVDDTAYIGTGNFVPHDYSSTRDFWVADTQPSDVSAITATFKSDFNGAETTNQASGGLVWSPGSTNALVDLISLARQSLLIENEEMDSSPVEKALIAAAHRGVDVSIVMTKDAEWTVALGQLAASGVHVRLLGASQIYIHAKVICADCTPDAGTVFIGSENFSTSSLDYNRELGIITSTRGAVQAVRTTVDVDFAIGASPAPRK